MNKNAKIILGGVGALGAIAGGLFLMSRKGTPAVAATPVPQPIPPQATPKPIPQAMPVPEVQVSPGVSPYDIPPEQWTQEQAAEVTTDKGNEARDAVGKLFGF